MKKLAHTILATAAAFFLIGFLPRLLNLDIDIFDLIRRASLILGSAMLAVGFFRFTLSVFYSADRRIMYQGAFCMLFGGAIITFSAWTFIAAVALIAWLDHKQQPLTKESAEQGAAANP